MKKFFLTSVMLALSVCLVSAQGTRKLTLESDGSAASAPKAASSSAAMVSGDASENAIEPPRIELSKNQICNVYSVDYCPDGKHLVAGYTDFKVRIWDITTGKMEKELKGHTGVVWSVAYSPDGKMIVSGSADRTVKCWNAETGELIRTLPAKSGDQGHSSIVSFVTFNTNGTYIASGSSDKSVKFWDTSTGELLQSLDNTHGKTIAAISYSSSGRYVATASWDKTAKIYHAMGGRERNLLTGHTEAVYAVEFSPDEKYVATGSADRTVRIYDVENGKFVQAIKGIAGEVWAIAYSPDGKTIATGNSDGSVILFDTATGKKLISFTGHQKEVRSCIYDKNGKHLFTGDSEGIIKMWDVEKGTLLVTMLQITDGSWVTWTPDGYLVGSDKAIEKLSYTVGDKKYSLEDIKATVYRPDVVAAQMQGTDRPEIDAKDSFEALISRQNTPTIEFTVSNADGTARKDNKQRDINVGVQIVDNGAGVGKVYIKLNGRSFLASDGAASVRGQTHIFSSATPLSLRVGKNTVSVSVFDSTNSYVHHSAVKEIDWQGNVQKSRLFVLAAGVDKYDDKNIAQLSGCVADATEMAETSRKYAGDLYINVFERVLADKAVTHDSLLTTIREFGKTISPDDVFILYLAGHGITHSDGDYYYIPSDYTTKIADPARARGVSKWELISALSAIRAENITVILDTCQSASFSSQSKPSEAELQQMSKEAIIEKFGALSGFDLISACTSAQVAVDNFKGHGVFTYCLLDGIKGAADLDQNGQVTSAELATYVIKEVPVQAQKKYGYKQEPQRSQPKFDFPMFGKLNPLEGRSIKEALEIAKLVQDKGIDLETATQQVAVVTTSVQVASTAQAAAELIAETSDSSSTVEDLKAADIGNTAPEREIGKSMETKVHGYLYDGSNAIIVNRSDIPGGKLSDEIHVFNASDIPSIQVTFSGYLEKKKTWKLLGSVNLNAIGKEGEIETTLKNRYSKFSIKPSVNVPLKISVKEEEDYLYVHLLSEETVDSAATVIDAKNVKGSFKDNIRLFSKTTDRNLAFYVYARKTESDPWVKVGAAFLKKKGDSDFVESALIEPVANYRYFAVLPSNNREYQYAVRKARNDLYITIGNVGDQLENPEEESSSE